MREYEEKKQDQEEPKQIVQIATMEQVIFAEIREIKEMLQLLLNKSKD